MPPRLVFFRNASHRYFEMAICCRNLEKGSFDWKMKGLVPLLSDLEVNNPPPTPTISPDIQSNADIAILFSVVVERSRNYVF